ncbi:fructose-6-phosphate aldolase [Hyphobacterium sp.]|uniref:fructose-6-phosphate aldolase n=1 Tax=Hyphobacterium sp. TaxID=2004662 RepID=UPI003BAA8269
MMLFLDTAELEEIAARADTGLVDGVTTNPSLIAKSGANIKERIADICGVIPGPISAEVVATETDGMIAEGQTLAAIAENVVVKLPLTVDGLKACRALTDQGIATNVTLCFSINQALLAAKAGATFVSPFIGRLDDLGEDGIGLIEDIRYLYDEHGFATRILAASIRSAEHVEGSAMAGADACTLPPRIFDALAQHELTDKGLEAFLNDWKSAGQDAI